MAKADTTWEKKLGKQIRAHRLMSGLTQQAAADLMRCPMRWWQSLEAGRNTSVDTLLRVGRVLKVPAWKLLRTIDAAPTGKPAGRTGRIALNGRVAGS